VFEDHGHAVRGFCQFRCNALFEEGEASVCADFAAEEEDDGTAGEVVAVVEVVEVVEVVVGMWLVGGGVVEMVDGDGDVVRWVGFTAVCCQYIETLGASGAREGLLSEDGHGRYRPVC